MSTPARLWLPAALGLLAAGCGPQLAQVSGRITVDGGPAANALITFTPDAPGVLEPGPCSEARADADGRYRLRVMGTQTAGIRPGKYDVKIEQIGSVKGDPDAPVPKSRRILKTEFKVEVTPAGNENEDFEVAPK